MLSTFIENLESAFKVYNKENNGLKLSLKNYNTHILRKIKNNKPLDLVGSVVNQVVEEFADQTELKKLELLNLLISKCQRNFESHGIIDCFIENVLNGEYEERDFIPCIIDETGIEMILDNNDRTMLMKLTHFHISRRRKQRILYVAKSKQILFYL